MILRSTNNTTHIEFHGNSISFRRKCQNSKPHLNTTVLLKGVKMSTVSDTTLCILFLKLKYNICIIYMGAAQNSLHLLRMLHKREGGPRLAISISRMTETPPTKYWV